MYAEVDSTKFFLLFFDYTYRRYFGRGSKEIQVKNVKKSNSKHQQIFPTGESKTETQRLSTHVFDVRQNWKKSTR